VGCGADYPKPIAKSAKVNGRGLYAILDPDKDWEFLGGDYQLTADSAVDRDGNVYFTSHRHNRILKVDAASGKINIGKTRAEAPTAWRTGPTAGSTQVNNDNKRIVAYSMDGKETVIAEGMQTHHLTVNARNEVYFGEAPKHQASMVDAKGGLHLVLKDALNWPKVTAIFHRSVLVRYQMIRTRAGWSFQVSAGRIADQRPAFLPSGNSGRILENRSLGMAFDTEGYLYVATNLGVQVCDQAGRVNAILNPPPGER